MREATCQEIGCESAMKEWMMVEKREFHDIGMFFVNNNLEFIISFLYMFIFSLVCLVWEEREREYRERG